MNRKCHPTSECFFFPLLLTNVCACDKNKHSQITDLFSTHWGIARMYLQVDAFYLILIKWCNMLCPRFQIHSLMAFFSCRKVFLDWQFCNLIKQQKHQIGFWSTHNSEKYTVKSCKGANFSSLPAKLGRSRNNGFYFGSAKKEKGEKRRKVPPPQNRDRSNASDFPIAKEEKGKN